MKNPALIRYESACEFIATEFVNKYYRKASPEVYWIGDKTGGLLSVNDELYDMDFMVEALRLKIGVKKMFEYYEYKMNAKTKSPINIEYFISRESLDNTS